MNPNRITAAVHLGGWTLFTTVEDIGMFTQRNEDADRYAAACGQRIIRKPGGTCEILDVKTAADWLDDLDRTANETRRAGWEATADRITTAVTGLREHVK